MARETILFEGDTEHEHYTVVERLYEGRPSRVLFSGERRAAQSGVGLDDNPDLLFDYNQRLLELASAVYPKRVLVIGGGAFTLPTALVGALPDAQVDVIELDEGLQAIAERYFGLKPHERLAIRYGDGRKFIETTTNMYDMIILDVFSDLSIPRQFLTAEFIEAMAAKVTPSGCVALNIIASYQGRNAGLIKSQVAAYGAVFDRLDIFPAAHGLTSWLPQNLVLCAQKAPAKNYAEYVRFAPIELVAADHADIYHDDAVRA